MQDYNYFFENSQLLNLFVAAFDDAFVYRYDARTRVAKEKIEVRYVNGPKHRVLHDLSDRAKTLTLPVVTIEQTSLARDPSRIHNKDQFIYRKQLDSTNRMAKIPQPIPVNLTLDVNIICYFKEDLDQIIQNFVVNCNPYIMVSWKVPEKFDMPFIDEIRSEIQWSGDISYENPKDLSPDVKWRISASTSFTVKGWLFKDYNQTQAPIYVVNADFHALPVSNRFCDVNDYDKITLDGVQSETVSISAYPEFTNYFVNGNPRTAISLENLNEKTFTFYGKRFNYDNSWYLSGGNISKLILEKVETSKSPAIFAYRIPNDLVTIFSDNIATITFPFNYFENLSGEFKFITANKVAWTESINLSVIDNQNFTPIVSTTPPPPLSTSIYLNEHVISGVDTRLVNKSPTSALSLYTVRNHTSGIYTRNLSAWCADLPKVLTCISPWNSSGVNNYAGTLISPRHIIFAAHYQIPTNAQIRFVDANNNVITRTMISKITHPDYTPYYPDLTVGLLDSDVPSEISFAKVLPNNWAEYITSFSPRIPALTLDQEEKALATDWTSENTYSGFSAPIDSKRLEFYEAKIVGDSGNPAIIIVNNEPVILTVWTFGGAGSGTSIGNQKVKLNEMMTTLGGGYQLTEIDLSGFTKP